MKLTWIGHSCFRLEHNNYTIIFDPYGDGTVPGLAPVREKANLVLCSHGHGDHNAAENVEIIKESENPFTITDIPTYHDEKQGTLRGDDTVRLLDDGTVKIIHFGDIGCELTDEQAALLSGADVAMIPVGGFYTVDAEVARHIVDQVNPKVVIPMHYRKDGKGGFGFDVIDTVDTFLEKCDNVVKKDTCTIELDAQMPAQTIVLVPKNVQEG